MMKRGLDLRYFKILPFAGMLTVMVIFSQSCYYDVEEVIYPSITCDTASVSYSMDVLPIIQTNCLNCHNQASAFGNVVLEGYNNLRIFAENGKLSGTINHVSGFSPMPQNQAKLRECDIAKIEKWISEGAPDN